MIKIDLWWDVQNAASTILIWFDQDLWDAFYILRVKIKGSTVYLCQIFWNTNEVQTQDFLTSVCNAECCMIINGWSNRKSCTNCCTFLIGRVPDHWCTHGLPEATAVCPNHAGLARQRSKSRTETGSLHSRIPSRPEWDLSAIHRDWYTTEVSQSCPVVSDSIPASSRHFPVLSRVVESTWKKQWKESKMAVKAKLRFQLPSHSVSEFIDLLSPVGGRYYSSQLVL